ncbi:MAG TPA: IS3 family transposase [Dissulfurispiraceae bacterium]|nr:IS3 family transposase [Dissulfurispiraceae bacterium]
MPKTSRKILRQRRYAESVRLRQESLFGFIGIRSYIEVLYNRQRKQAQLGYLSPAAYERQFYKELLAA